MSEQSIFEILDNLILDFCCKHGKQPKYLVFSPETRVKMHKQLGDSNYFITFEDFTKYHSIQIINAEEVIIV